MEALEKNNNQVLVQVICSKEAHEIEVLNAAFSRSNSKSIFWTYWATKFFSTNFFILVFKKNLSDEISQKTSHGFGRMLRAILSANRSDLPTDYCLAQKEASILYDVCLKMFLINFTDNKYAKFTLK